MGQGIDDPRQTEGEAIHIDGMGLLPVTTVMGEKKVTCQTEFTLVEGSERMRGYEIHQGISTPTDNSYSPLTKKADGETEGCFVDSHCMGTYLHGCLDNPAFVDFLLGQKQSGGFDYAKYKEEHYDRLADHVRKHVDMAKVYEILKR